MTSMTPRAGAAARRSQRCTIVAGGFGKPRDTPSVSRNKAVAPSTTVCPCGGGKKKLSYSKCCKPYHTNKKQVEDPLTLLRTRFSAYCKGKSEYIIASTHEENTLLKEGGKTKDGVVVSSLAADIAATCEKVSFYDLEIIKEYGGQNEEIHNETSLFEKIHMDNGKGKWLFRDSIDQSKDG